MKLLPKVFAVLMLLLVTSCNKESRVDIYDDEPIQFNPPSVEISNDFPFSDLNFSEETYINHYLSNTDGREDEDAYIPTYQMLLEVVEVLEADEAEYSFLDNFLENYGSFEWNYSFMKKQNDLCFISIPTLKNDQLTGVLKFYKKGNETALRFVSKSVVDEIVLTYEFSGDIDLLKGAVLDLMAFETNMNQSIDRNYAEWLRRNGLTNGESSRGEYWCIWDVYYSYVLTGVVVEPYDGTVTTFWELASTSYNFECFYQTSIGGFPNDYIPTNGNGGGNSNTTTTDNTNTEEPPTPQENCLKELGLATQLYINDFRNSNVTFPCGESMDEVISNVLMNMIETGQCEKFGGLDAFLEGLSQFDFIRLGESFSSNDKVNCIWNNIINSNSDVMCTTLSNFFGSSSYDLTFYVQDFQSNPAHAITDKLDEGGGYYISLNQEYVNEACPIEILETILHEAIHAEILRRQDTYTLAEQEQLYPEMMSYFNDPNLSDWHHEYMANEWFDALLESVISFYPSGFTLAEYESIVWAGLHETSAFAQDSGMTETELNDQIELIRTNCDKSCD